MSNELAVRATQLKHDLMAAGLYRSGQAMERVTQEIGWELAEQQDPAQRKLYDKWKRQKDKT